MLKRLEMAVSAAVLMTFLLVSPAMAQTEVEIQVSPSVLNMDSLGVWVTVHADIPLSSVDGVSVTLDGLPVKVVKADSLGDLVAKFALDEVKAILPLGSVELTLSGTTKDGIPFIGREIVLVIKVSGKR